MRKMDARARLCLVAVFLAGCGGMGPALPSTPDSVAVLGTIPVGTPPTLLAVSPDGRHVYAASNAQLAVIDTASRSVATTLSIDPNSTAVAVSPDGAHVYVASLFSINLTVLDTATNTLGPPVQLFLQRLRGGFTWMTFAPDGGTAYIANPTNRAFAVVALPSGQGNILSPEVSPSDVAISPDGSTVYLAGCKPICTPGFLQLYDTASQRFTQQIQIDGNPYRIAVSRDGTRAYTANLTGPSVSVVDLRANQVIATVSVPVQPTGLAVSPDGGTVWVASQTGGALTAIDTASNQVRSTVPVALARDVVVTPDGRQVYVSSERAVVVVNAAAVGSPG